MITFMFIMVIALALSNIFTFLVLANGGQALKALANAGENHNTALRALQEEVNNIYLTEDDRKSLGLPARMVKEVEAKPKLPCSNTSHSYSGEFVDKYRISTNKTHSFGDDHVVVRVCRKCDAREVRGSKKDGKYTWYFD